MAKAKKISDKTFEKYKLVMLEWLSNGQNGVQAYQKIYPKANKITADGNFRKIHANTRVSEWIKVKQAEKADKANLSVEIQLKKTSEAYELAKRLDNPTAMLKAVEVENKMLGFNAPDEIKHSGEMKVKQQQIVLPEGQTTNDLKEEIQELVNGQD